MPRASICTLLVAALSSTLLTGCAGLFGGSGQPRLHDMESLHQRATADPYAPEPWYQMARVHSARHQYDDALRALHAALLRHADYEPALTLMCKLFYDSGRSVEGVHYFSSRPFDAWPEPVRVDVALLLADAGRFDEARVLLEAARDGVHADAARANLAYLDWIVGEQARAEGALESLDGSMDSVALHNNVALARLRRGEVEKSAAMLEEIAREHPQFSAPASNLALVLRHWLFEDERAGVFETQALAVEPPRLSEAVLYELLSVSEDTSPPVPTPVDGAGQPNADPEESKD